ncbi:MAG: hypothetical protein AVDCRST_MAG78-2902 [uncultured Rubrobacteraceae bacterium]|uniref:Uncharacterized protein n=1 Tax=uncultured Rubrobacteraceae bacterium TaxID=349277 RepID=A0A6J4QTU5_9ACTN|nr:MAG: hypothetical protein AVDCRST_MAG78-2902 [uncultured Rubrobacteraceae bacterium]
MEHYVELESGRSALERRACGGKGVLLDQEEAGFPESDTASVLQCGDSLTIAANRIGEEVFGIERLLRGFTRSVEIALTLACLVPLSPPWLRRLSKRTEG